MRLPVFTYLCFFMLSLQNISIYNGSIPLLEDCSINLDGHSGKKIAIVGKNGCGKSTMLKLLTGENQPDKGTVLHTNEVIGYLPQEITFPKEYSLVGEYLESLLAEPWMQYQIDIGLQQLGLPAEFLLQELGHLSGGEKVKTALAGLLLEEPTILLFDEPTNNLDMPGISWLENFIKEFPGTVVFVSHDRELINHVSQYVWEIDHEDCCLRVYGGNYEFFQVERQRRREKQLQQYEAQYKEIVALEDWLKANEFHPKYRFSDRVLSQKQALENLRKNLVKKPLAEPKISPQLASKVEKGLVAKVVVEKKTLPERDILKKVTIAIHHHEKVLVRGANGAGKTTLLNILAGIDVDFAGSRQVRPELRIGYLKQFPNLDKQKTVLENFLHATYTSESEARAILAKYLFSTEYMISKLCNVSQGELRRLDLAIILTNKPDLLLLDEPTNHLDIFSREALENFITQENIPMVLVSHDRYFTEKLQISTTLEL